jgi:hypothetical protein
MSSEVQIKLESGNSWQHGANIFAQRMVSPLSTAITLDHKLITLLDLPR